MPLKSSLIPSEMVVLSTEAISHLSQCHWQKQCQRVMKYRSFLNFYKILKKFPYTNLIPPHLPFYWYGSMCHHGTQAKHLSIWASFRMWISWVIYSLNPISDSSFQDFNYLWKNQCFFHRLGRKVSLLSSGGQNLHNLTTLHHASNPLRLNAYAHTHSHAHTRQRDLCWQFLHV